MLAPGPDALDLHRPAPTGAGAGTDAPANTWSTGAELVGETTGDMEMADGHIGRGSIQMDTTETRRFLWEQFHTF